MRIEAKLRHDLSEVVDVISTRNVCCVLYLCIYIGVRLLSCDCLRVRQGCNAEKCIPCSPTGNVIKVECVPDKPPEADRALQSLDLSHGILHAAANRYAIRTTHREVA